MRGTGLDATGTVTAIEEGYTEPHELERSAFTLLACVLILLGLGTVMVWSAAAVEAASPRAFHRFASLLLPFGFRTLPKP